MALLPLCITEVLMKIMAEHQLKERARKFSAYLKLGRP